MERRPRRALDPLAVPAAVGQSVLEEPVDDAGDVGAEPQTVRERPGVDAAVDLAAPVRQVVVLPAAVRGEQFGRAALTQDSGVEAPLPQRVQRPRRRRPRLPGTFCRLGAVEVEVCGEERAARPLAVRVLEREKARAEAFGRDPCPRRFPDLWRFAARGRARPASAVPGQSRGATRSGRRPPWSDSSETHRRRPDAHRSGRTPHRMRRIGSGERFVAARSRPTHGRTKPATANSSEPSGGSSQAATPTPYRSPRTAWSGIMGSGTRRTRSGPTRAIPLPQIRLPGCFASVISGVCGRVGAMCGWAAARRSKTVMQHHD